MFAAVWAFGGALLNDQVLDVFTVDVHRVSSVSDWFLFICVNLCVRVPVCQLVDYRVDFSKWWQSEFKSVKFPAQGTVFDFYIDPETRRFEPWSRMVPDFVMDPDCPLQVQTLTCVLLSSNGFSSI